MSKKKKVLIGVLVYFLVAGIILAIISQTETFKSAGETLPPYRIVKIEDVSIAKAKRYSYNIVVDGQPSVSDLEKIGNEIIAKAKREKPFNALVVSFYDYEVLIRTGMRLGSILVSPNGKIADAGTVNTGDYNKMKKIVLINAVDWDKALTAEEAEMIAEFLQNSSGDEAADTERVLQKYGRTSEQFDEIFDRYISWRQPSLQ